MTTMPESSKCSPLTRPGKHRGCALFRAWAGVGLLLVVTAFATGCHGRFFQRTHRQAAVRQADIRAAEAVDLGTRLKEQGLMDQALLEFEKAIEINPTMTTAYLGTGEIYRERGDYQAAETQYAQAVKNAPGDFEPNYWHGFTLQMLNRVAESVRAYLRALSIRPEDFHANLNLATAYLQLGENAQAVIYAERAVRIDPEDGPARVNLGASYSNAGRYAEALSEYEAAAELMPLTTELMLNLAQAQGRVGRYAEMAGTLRSVIAKEPTALAYERLGSAQFHMSNYDEALKAFTRATELDAQHYPAWNGVGVCLLNKYVWSKKTDLVSLDNARNALRRSLKIKHDQPRIAELLTRY